MGLDALSDRSPGHAFLAGGGEVARRIAAHDWAPTPLGPPETWPASLRTTVSLVLNSRFPTYLAWGPELLSFWNDAYLPVLGSKPAALGCPFPELWAEIWVDIGPICGRAMAGESSFFENLPLTLSRHGYPERTWWTFAHSPVRIEDGSVGGVLCVVHETTSAVLGEQRNAFRLGLERRLRDLTDPQAVMDAAVDALGRHLGASRVGYGQVQADGARMRVVACYADGAQPLSGVHVLDVFGPRSVARQRDGRMDLSNDVQADPEQGQESWAALDTRAFAAVPLVRDGAFRASFCVNFKHPHRWT